MNDTSIRASILCFQMKYCPSPASSITRRNIRMNPRARYLVSGRGLSLMNFNASFIDPWIPKFSMTATCGVNMNSIQGMRIIMCIRIVGALK